MTGEDIMIRGLALAVLSLPLAIGASSLLAQETYTVDPVHSQPPGPRESPDARRAVVPWPGRGTAGASPA